MKRFNQTLTLVPDVDLAAAGWFNDDVRLYRLETPLTGLAGEVADHIVASYCPARWQDGDPEVMIFASDEHGGESRKGSPPVAEKIGETSIDAFLAELGFSVKGA